MMQISKTGGPDFQELFSSNFDGGDYLRNSFQWLRNSSLVPSRVHRVGVFNFGTDRARVLEKTSGFGSGTDRVWVLALHFYQSGIIGY